MCVIIILCTIIGCITPNYGIWKWQWIFFRLTPFVVGMYVSYVDFRYKVMHVIFSISLFSIALVYQLIVWPQYLSALPSEIFVLPYSLSLPVLIAGTSSIVNKQINRWFYKTIELFGIYSLEIYLTHEVIISGLRIMPFSQIIQFIFLIVIVVPAVIFTKYGVSKINSVLSLLIIQTNKLLKIMQ